MPAHDHLRDLLVGCSGLVIGVGWLNVGVTRSTRSASGARGRHCRWAPRIGRPPLHSPRARERRRGGIVADAVATATAVQNDRGDKAAANRIRVHRGLSCRGRRVRRRAGPVGLAADHHEVLVELNVGLAAVARDTSTW